MSVASIKQALTDRHALALTIWGEARGESVEARIAVGMVVKHRKNHPRRWPREWRKVCHQRWQFSCWQRSGGAGNHEAVMRWARYFVPDDTQQQIPNKDEYPLVMECLYLADGIMQDVLIDSVRRADHYYSPLAMIPPDSEPSWARNRAPVAIVGGSRFFRLAV